MNILIIEDEIAAANDLAETIQRVQPGAVLTETLPSVEKSISYLKDNASKIDLIFSDIHLNDGLAFEIFSHVHVNVPVIFCTAYDQYALKAFQSNGIHYILKPYSDTEIENAFTKLKTLSAKNDNSGALNMDAVRLFIEKEKQKTKTILIYHKDRILPIPLEKVNIFYIQDEAVMAQVEGGHNYVVNYTLDKAQEICGDAFYRTSRRHLVNRDYIAHAVQYFNRRLLLKTKTDFPEQLLVSKEKSSEFLKWLSA